MNGLLRVLILVWAIAGSFHTGAMAGSVTLVGAGSAGPGPTCTFTRIDFTTGSLGAASLSRGSSATYVNSSGVLTTASTNVARFNYDTNYPGGNAAPSLTGPFLLVEPASTNLLLQSNTFSNATWTITSGNGTITAASFTGPDGTNTGWYFATTSFFISIFQSNTFSAVPYTMSVWAKEVVGTDGLILQPSTASGTLSLTTSLERYGFNVTPAAGAALSQIYNAGAPATNGLWGAQLELGAASGYFATNSSSYIVTTTATASRSADVVAFTQPAGCGHNTYTFDNGTTEAISQAAGSATVPTNLNRPNIKFIDGSS
jgi:hypothetical protein